MKILKELNFEEMSVKQKLGFVNVALYHSCWLEENEAFLFAQIRDRALGAIWIQQGTTPEEEAEVDRRIAKVREAADYPILILTDAESGMGDYKIGRHNPLACTGDEAYAYAFGKAVGVTARRRGYNMVCNPLLDMEENGSNRVFGPDKEKVARFAAAEAKGMHDAGVLTVGKHYPSPKNDGNVDSHMVESVSWQTKEELIEDSLYPYRALMKEGLLDGVMVAHALLGNIDSELPASLSAPVKDIIRELGFEGVIVSDALCMMGVRAKHGRVKPMGMALESGCDLPMMFDNKLVFNQSSLYECYEQGIISDEKLDAAVKRILAAQHKALAYEMSGEPSLTEEEERRARGVELAAVCEKRDEGCPAALSADGKHFFALMVDNGVALQSDKVEVDTFSSKWYNYKEIEKKLKAAYPASRVVPFYEHPNQSQCWALLNASLDYDDVVFVTYSEFLAYTGAEHFTHRVISVAEAMQYTGKISTVLHFGNPMVLEELPHVPRVIMAGASREGIAAGLSVLSGEKEAHGVMTYPVSFK
ncbi:MAG: hypothetical protein J6R89_04680 [Clostridia bacterium]|nr:hypothetical protein [Clostridia bacterium]